MEQKASACERTSGPMSPEEESRPRQQVWVLEIQHRHGSDISVHATEDSAYSTLAQYCRDWWTEAYSTEKEPADDLTDSAIIDQYFEAQQDESSDVFQCEVQP